MKRKKLESVRGALRPLPAGQRKNWQDYRERFVEPGRIEAGRQFMQAHAETLSRAGHQFGVPVEVIVGIIGVETFYGRHTGRFRVVDALATLAFDYPTEGRDRSAYFREQLAHFFVWCAKEQCQPPDIRGSYAGAMGIPQFMPENIHRYGTDFDGDGHVDLDNPVDAIGSVARFLARHGWVRELEPVFPVGVEGAQLEPLLAPDILPTFTPEQLAAYGAQPLNALPQREVFALVELQNGDADSEYVLGSRNFFVLTRYNRSSYYAMAVLQLGREVVAREAAAANQPGDNANAAASCETC
jgi:lytic murein transglycosylase B